MNNSNGFSMIEILFTLSIISVISMFVIAPMFQTIEEQETKHFFELLKSDMLYIQNKTLRNPQNVRIVLQEDSYSIFSGQALLVKRAMPKTLKLVTLNNLRIAFSTNGNALTPTTYSFKNSRNFYRMVFPFGKGRFYIEQ